MLAPVEAEPPDVLLDGLDVLDVLRLWVGVVEAEVTHAAVLRGEPEVQAARLGMPDMQVAVGLGRKARLHPTAVFPRALVVADHGADEVGARGPAAGTVAWH